ncbi:MAG: Ig-like domain-containing protein [Woeseiaceae bacterium]|jgi:hypothetical protein
MRSLASVLLTIFSLALAACGGGGSSSSPAAPPVPPPPPVTSPPPPPVNSVPVASDVSVKTNVDEPLDAALSGQDADGDALTYSVTVLPTIGTVQVMDAAAGTFRYTPGNAAFGTDQFRYRVDDGTDNSAEATVTVVVNRKPAAQDQSMRAATSLPAAGTLVGTDEDGDPVSFAIATQPANGTVVLDAATGSFTYNATADFEGTDSFTYQANDGFADSPPATVTLSVNEWLGTVNLGTADDEETNYGLQIDEQMNLYVAYSTSGAVPGSVSNGKQDVVLAKVDKAGTVLWQKQWGHAENDFPYQMVRHSDGSLYMTVTGRADDGTLTYAYVTKFDADGNLVWELAYPVLSEIQQFYRMVISPDGNVFVSVVEPWPGAPAPRRARLMKISPFASIEWIKVLGTIDDDAADPLLNAGPYDEYWVFPRGLAVDANETIYMNLRVGTTVAGTSSSVTMLASLDGTDGTILSRLEPLVTSAFPIDMPSAILPDMHLTAAGNLRVLGFRGLGLPDDTAGLVLAELDTAGNEIWSTLWSVADEDRAGFKGVLAADGSSIVRGIAETVASAGANVDVSITKFDSAGDFAWESILSGTLADGTTDVFDSGSQPVVDADGSVFVLVYSDGGAIGSTTNQGGGDVFIVKLDGDTGEMIHP